MVIMNCRPSLSNILRWFINCLECFLLIGNGNISFTLSIAIKEISLSCPQYIAYTLGAIP